MVGCDKTSRVFGVGEEVALRLVRESDSFRVQDSIFEKQSALRMKLLLHGEKPMVLIYKGRKHILPMTRLKRFCARVTNSKTVIQLRHLPPISSSSMFHSFSVCVPPRPGMDKLAGTREMGLKKSRLMPYFHPFRLGSCF